MMLLLLLLLIKECYRFTQYDWLTCERVGAVANLTEPALVLTDEVPLVGGRVAADHQTVAVTTMPVVARTV